MSTPAHIKMIVAGGGTGGHIFPALAIAHAVRGMAPDSDILFVGAKGKMEMEKVPKEGYRIIGLDIAGMNRSAVLKNLSLPWKIIKSLLEARKIVREFKPDVVVGVGGYASFPVLMMAQWKGIPTLIQEQNSFAGRANRYLGKRAKSVCVAYDGMDRFFPKEVILLTGNPVRQTISQGIPDRLKGKLFFQLDETKKTIFAFGGSLGARSMNEVLADQFQQLLQQGYQLLWQTGTPFYEKAKEAVKGFERQVKVFEFIREMDLAYAAADCIIARAGASSIAELCIAAKPVVFVPYPYASEDHQTHNAQALVMKHAAAMVRDHELKSKLIPEVLALASDSERIRMIETNLKQLAVYDADQRIAKKIFTLKESA